MYALALLGALRAAETADRAPPEPAAVPAASSAPAVGPCSLPRVDPLAEAEAVLARWGVEPAWLLGEARAGCTSWERATPRVAAGRVFMLVVADRRPRWRVEIYSPDEAIYEVECASGYLPAGDGVAAAQRRAVLAAADLLRKHRPAA